MWIVLMIMACNCAPRVSERADTAPARTPPTLKPGPITVSADEGPRLYAACQERVEGPESPGECAQDSDCVPAGCSLELCVAEAQAEEAFSSCETRLCFSVLERCGCQEGLCRWSVKAGPEGDEPQ